MPSRHAHCNTLGIGSPQRQVIALALSKEVVEMVLADFPDVAQQFEAVRFCSAPCGETRRGMGANAVTMASLTEDARGCGRVVVLGERRGPMAHGLNFPT